MQKIKFSQLSMAQQDLLLKAEEAMQFAYNPYSHFSVGAALLAQDGSVHVGTNLENATFDLTIHAEASALASANTKGVRTFSALAVIGKPKEGVALEPIMPCGICRQNLYEFSQLGSSDLVIIASNTNKDSITLTSIQELLPAAFGPKDLGVDLSVYAHPLSNLEPGRTV